MDRRRALGYLCLTVGIGGLVVVFVGFLADALEPPASTDQMLSLGEERLRGGDLTGAAEWFMKAVESEPDRLEPRLATGRVQELRGELDSAVEAYQKAVELAPDELGPTLALARALERSKRDTEAQSVLDRAREQHPDAPEPLVVLAQLHVDNGDLDEARAAYRQLEAVAPSDARGALGEASIAELSHDAAGALEAYTRATEVDDGSRTAWEGVGRTAASLSKIERAEAAYKRVVALGPDDAGALTVLATIIERRERYDEAARTFRKALDLLADAPREARETRALAWTGLGTCQLAMGHRDEAYEAFASALTDDPDQPEALWGLVPVYLEREQFEAARDALRRLVGHRGDDPVYWVLVGRSEAGMGRWREARQAFQRALEIDENDLEAQSWYGVALRALGVYRTAALVLERVVRRRPDDELAQLNLAIALGQLGEVGRAREVFAEARRLMPGQAAPLAHEAHLLLTVGQVELARPLAEEAVAAEPHDPAALEVLARVLERQGEGTRARELVAEALRNVDDRPRREYLEGLEQELGGDAGTSVQDR